MTNRGTCPSLWEPMATGDGLLVRVKPPGGGMSAAQAHALAAAARRWGNGVIEATSRANLQVRGLRPEGVGRFAAAMVAAGLGHPDPTAERRRNVIATPLAGCDPAVSPHAGPVASALEAGLVAAADMAGLPAKFGFLVDGGGVLGLGRVRADIRVRLLGDRCEVGLDGGKLAATGAAEEGAGLALALTRAFLGKGDGRMRELLEEMDEAALFATCGLAPVPQSPPGPEPAAPVGRLPADAFGLGLPFGSTEASALHGLADAAGQGTLRMTPWRALVLTGADPAGLEGLPFITDPKDPRLRVTACPGQPACASATVETRALAAALAGHGVGTVHVSGCSKGCAHPGPATLTLVGREGRFDVVRQGRAGDAPSGTGLAPADVLAEAGW